MEGRGASSTADTATEDRRKARRESGVAEVVGADVDMEMEGGMFGDRAEGFATADFSDKEAGLVKAKTEAEDMTGLEDMTGVHGRGMRKTEVGRRSHGWGGGK